MALTPTVGDKVLIRLDNGYQSVGVVVKVFKNGGFRTRETTTAGSAKGRLRCYYRTARSVTLVK